MKSFEDYKLTYELINEEFETKIDQMLDNNLQNTYSLIIAIGVIDLILFVMLYTAYRNYFQLIKRYIRCSEQVAIKTIDEEI